MGLSGWKAARRASSNSFWKRINATDETPPASFDDRLGLFREITHRTGQFCAGQVMTPLLQAMNDMHRRAALQAVGQRQRIQFCRLADGVQQNTAFFRTLARLCPVQRLQGREPGLRQRMFRVLDPLLVKPGYADLTRRGMHGEAQAAAEDGRQQLLRLVRNQQKQQLASRFFQGLEQRVGRIVVHRFGRMDDHHAIAATMSGQIGEAGQVAYLVHRDLARRFFAAGFFLTVFGRSQCVRLDEAKIGVTVLFEPVTGSTFLTGHSIGMRLFAQQRLRKIHGQIELAYPLRPLQQQRMRQSGAQPLQGLP